MVVGKSYDMKTRSFENLRPFRASVEMWTDLVNFFASIGERTFKIANNNVLLVHDFFNITE